MSVLWVSPPSLNHLNFNSDSDSTNRPCHVLLHLKEICFVLQVVAPLDASNEDSNPIQRTERHGEPFTGDVTPSGTFNAEELDVNLRRSSSDRRTSEGGDASSLERSKSSPSRTKPPVPKRPASIKKKPQSSVDAILESTQTDDTISPLRPVSLQLLRDTMASLPADAQEFLFSETEINSLTLGTAGEQSEIKSNSNSQTESELQESLTAQNHIGAVNLSRLQIRRDSGPYDNLPKNNQAIENTQKLDINHEDNKCDNQSNTDDSQQSWVSFD